MLTKMNHLLKVQKATKMNHLLKLIHIEVVEKVHLHLVLLDHELEEHLIGCKITKVVRVC